MPNRSFFASFLLSLSFDFVLNGLFFWPALEEIVAKTKFANSPLESLSVCCLSAEGREISSAHMGIPNILNRFNDVSNVSTS